MLGAPRKESLSKQGQVLRFMQSPVSVCVKGKNFLLCTQMSQIVFPELWKLSKVESLLEIRQLRRAASYWIVLKADVQAEAGHTRSDVSRDA